MKEDKHFNFGGEDIYVGLDVHVKDWKVAIFSKSTSYKQFCQPPVPEVLVRYLERRFPGARYHCTYEAGYCGFWIHDRLETLGVDCTVINPADVPTTNKERVVKNDKVDARKMGRSLRDGRLEAIYVPSRMAQEDRSLVRSRSMLVKKQTRVKNQIKALLRFYGIDFEPHLSHWSRAFIGWLREISYGERPGLLHESGRFSLSILLDELEYLRGLILKTTRAIRSLATSEDYRDRVEHLVSLPGISTLTAMIILTELVDMSRFKNLDSLACYVGLVPSTHSTGDREGTGPITPRRSGFLRHVLIESAWVGVRNDTVLMASFEKLVKRMPKNKAIIRIARKQLARIRYVLRNDCTYVPVWEMAA